MQKRVKIFIGLLLAFGILLGVAWFSGGATWALLYVAEHHALPYRADKEFTLTGLSHLDSDIPAPTNRVRITISQNRMKQALADSGGWSWTVPPGLVRDRLLIEGDWTPHSHGESVDVAIPVEVLIADTEGDHPHLSGTLPVSMLNAYMDVEFEEDFVNEDEEYVLGHFDYTFRPRILEATLQTTNSTSLPPGQYAEQIGIDVRARGKVKLKFEENLFRASTDGNIDLLLKISATSKPTDAGMVMDYDAVFKWLKGNVKNLHSYGDKKVAEKLKKKWTRSLNKEKRKKKLARHPIPVWAPLDFVIDLHFYAE